MEAGWFYRQFVLTIINSVFILRKSVNKAYNYVNLFSNQNANSTIVIIQLSLTVSERKLHVCSAFLLSRRRSCNCSIVDVFVNQLAVYSVSQKNPH